ncbi:MAG: 3-phosphoglycerate dehydrogenase, partial [Gammaproteobacteria bacterium]|nr:3-phosphoglycerate dehydrogenase [Gammaproteobacteria bacterium]
NAERLKLMKKGGTILNFARGGIVDDAEVVAALDSGELHAYVCDFPTNLIKDHPQVISLPHLGASTGEAEVNCAVMVAHQVRDYLENGNVVNSVNFPTVQFPRTEGVRLAVVNSNVPNMVGQITTAVAAAGLNIIDLINKSRGDLAYTLIDVSGDAGDVLFAQLRAIDGVLNVRRV